MSAKPTGYVLIAVSLLGIGFSLFKNEDVLSGSWFNDQSTLIALIICIIVLTIGVRLVKK